MKFTNIFFCVGDLAATGPGIIVEVGKGFAKLRAVNPFSFSKSDLMQFEPGEDIPSVAGRPLVVWTSPTTG